MADSTFSNVLDQSVIVSTHSAGSQSQWQSFTVGIVGKLSKFEWLTGNPNPVAAPDGQPIVMKLYQGQGVSGTLIHTSSGLTTPPSGQDWVVFDFSTLELNVQVGDVYTVQLTTDQMTHGWLTFKNDIVGTTARSSYTGANFNFKSYIIIVDPTCFPAGTPVQTDQGVTAIEQLVPGEHTLRGKSIIAITQTRPLQKHIVCFEKDSIGKNVPSQQTLCSKEHKVLYRGEMIKARDLADMCKNVKKVSYNGESLYNVLLEKHGKMLVNNMICETLHPENIAAKFAKSKNSPGNRIVA